MPAQHAIALVDRIDDLLPQTQCRRCGFDGCRPYAAALADRQAPLNRCPPGGEATIDALSALLGVPAMPLDPSLGKARSFPQARVEESLCIGCTLCIQACPVDAIVGAAKLMHTVLAERCTGCELCLPPCPVDCIELIDTGREWSRADARAAAEYARARTQRLERGRQKAALAKSAAPTPGKRTAGEAPVAPVSAEARRAAVAEALLRARARRSGAG